MKKSTDYSSAALFIRLDDSVIMWRVVCGVLAPGNERLASEPRRMVKTGHDVFPRCRGYSDFYVILNVNKT